MQRAQHFLSIDVSGVWSAGGSGGRPRKPDAPRRPGTRANSAARPGPLPTRIPTAKPYGAHPGANPQTPHSRSAIREQTLPTIFRAKKFNVAVEKKMRFCVGGCGSGCTLGAGFERGFCVSRGWMGARGQCHGRGIARGDGSLQARDTPIPLQ